MHWDCPGPDGFLTAFILRSLTSKSKLIGPRAHQRVADDVRAWVEAPTRDAVDDAAACIRRKLAEFPTALDKLEAGYLGRPQALCKAYFLEVDFNLEHTSSQASESTHGSTKRRTETYGVLQSIHEVLPRYITRLADMTKEEESR
eukprot:scaffold3045_cov134-Pinguiococcus_pyrenoidosus.AAC.2